MRFGMFFPSFERISEGSLSVSLQQTLEWKLVLVVKLNMPKQAGKKHNYPTTRKSYTASRAGVGGRPKKKKNEGANSDNKKRAVNLHSFFFSDQKSGEGMLNICSLPLSSVKTYAYCVY